MNPFQNSFDKFLSKPEAKGGLGLSWGVDEMFYHYTGENQIRLIREKLRCKHIKKYLGLGEFEFGWSCLKQAEEVKSVVKKCRGEILDAEDMINSSLPIYIFSMCRIENDTRMIAYAKEKYNADACAMLPIKGNRVYQLVNQMMRMDVQVPGRICKHFLLPCLYQGRDENKIKKLIGFAFKEYLEELLQNEKIKTRYANHELITTLMFMVCTMIKGESDEGRDLSYENEVRLIAIGDKSIKMGDWVEFGFENSEWRNALGDEEIK